MNQFLSLGLSAELSHAVSQLGYSEPTPIQIQAIPLLLAGTDVIGQAQTGTGKTAAFTLPMLEQINPNLPHIQAIIMTPTRELNIQVAQSVHRYGSSLGIRVLPIYGGQSYQRQMSRLENRPHVIVGTPGRTLDLIRQKALNLSHVVYVVLDEADEMLKMGFRDDMEAILKALPRERQTAMFSATLSKDILKLASSYMVSPQEIKIESSTKTVAAIQQIYHLVHRPQKLAALRLILEGEAIQQVLIFTKTRSGAAELTEQLNALGYAAEALHGDLNQNMRETVLRRFRKGELSILIGTDVMARGVDIPEVSHVVNYDLPMTLTDYVHRIGRTGRAGRTGYAISLITPSDVEQLEAIQKYTNQPMQRLALPSPEDIYLKRDALLLGEVAQILEDDALSAEVELIGEMLHEGYQVKEVAAALLHMVRRNRQRPLEAVREAEVNFKNRKKTTPFDKKRATASTSSKNMVKLTISLGQTHGIQAKDIVGAVANEAGISGRSIGIIEVKQNETFFDVKADVANKVLEKMRRSTLRGSAMNIRRV